MLGLNCALRGGIEHNKLRRPGCKPQISVQYDTRGEECLVYNEDPLQKTNQGGLQCKPNQRLSVFYRARDRNRCPVYLYKKYINLLPKTLSCKKLYLRPRKICLPNLWYGDQPYGINKIKNTVKAICSQAGLQGKFTNHSLRATCASRMYAKEVPEQLIKEVTGHKSDCVRQYKRTSEELKQKASNTVTNNVEPSTSSGIKRAKLENLVTLEDVSDVKEKGSELLSIEQMIENIRKTKEELNRRKSMVARSRLSLKKRGKCNKKVTIDVNLNIIK